MSDIRLAKFTFGFKPSQLRSILGSRDAEGLRVIALPKRQIRLDAWMLPSPRVVKLIMDGCFKGNFGMSVSGGILHDYQCVVLAAFGSLLGLKPILYTELMVVCKEFELVDQLGYFILEVKSDSTIVTF